LLRLLYNQSRRLVVSEGAVMAQMGSCPTCHQQVNFGAKFCGYCGTPLTWQQQIRPLPNHQPQQRFQRHPRTMRILDWIGNIWLILACTVILVGYVSIVVINGWSKLWDILSPFNIFNWLAVLATLAPGIGIKIFAERLRNRQSNWQKATELDPVTAYFERADTYAFKGKWRQAIADFTQVIQLDPEWAQAYLYRGALYYDLNMKEEALSDYTKFLTLTEYKTDEDALEEWTKHDMGEKVFPPLADPKMLTKVFIENTRQHISKTIKELQSG